MCVGCASVVSPTPRDATPEAGERLDAAEFAAIDAVTTDRPADVRTPRVDAPDARIDASRDVPRADTPTRDAPTGTRDASTPDMPSPALDAADASLTSDVTEDLAGLTTCSREGSEWWSADDDAGLVACVLCRCRAGAYRCAARSPDAAPRVTPEYIRDAAPTVPMRYAAIDEGLYQLVRVRWYGAAAGTAPTTQELAEVTNPPASHTYIALSTRTEGRDEVTHTLYFTRVGITGAMIPYSRYCPSDLATIRGATYDADADGFTLYLPETNDAGESVQARTYRRAP